MGNKATFSFTLTGNEAKEFFDLKERMGWSCISNTSAMRILLAMAVRGSITLKSNVATSESSHAKPEPPKPNMEMWEEFAEISNIYYSTMPHFWQGRRDTVLETMHPTIPETDKQKAKRYAEAEVFMKDWKAWEAGNYPECPMSYLEWFESLPL